MKINSYTFSEIGKVRKANEDSCGSLETKNGHVFVVCDGMGGHVGGAKASSLAVKSVLEFFNGELYDNLILAIDRSFQFANEQIFAYAQSDPSFQGMGTTIVVLIIKNNDCYIGHIGDSRIYLKTDGQLHRLTKDHSFVQGLVDQGIITDDQAENHPQRNQILKALGHSLDIQGTICPQPIKVKTGDVFLLCSDGLNGMISDEFINQCIDFNNLVDSGGKLYQSAMDNRGSDNITATLIGIVEGNNIGKSQFTSYNPVRNDATLHHFDVSSDYSKTITGKSKKSKGLKQAMILTTLLVIIAVGVLVYSKYGNKGPGTKPGGNGPGSFEGGIKDTETYSKADLQSKTYTEIVELVNDHAKTVENIGDSIKIKTKDQKSIVIHIKDNIIEKVEEIKPSSTTPASTNGTQSTIVTNGNKNSNNQSNKGKTLTIKVEQRQNISSLIKEINKKTGNNSCKVDPKDEDELFKLNYPAMQKRPPSDKSNYDKSRMVPEGFIFKYKCK